VTLGNVTGSTVAPNMYPAKFTFDITANPSCTDDFAVFAVNKPGLAAAATQTGTFAAIPPVAKPSPSPMVRIP